MSAICPPVTVPLDAALDVVQWEQACVRREPPSTGRALRIAELYEREARLWRVLFEHTGVRVYWRAALAAELSARQCARRWRRQATAQAPVTPCSMPIIVGSAELGVDGLSLNGSSGGVA